VDRKQFFKDVFCLTIDAFEKTKIGQTLTHTVENSLKHRPPGAQQTENAFLELCTGCDACMSACPVNVILIEDLEKRDPVIYSEEDPCIHCPGTPCISACPTGALDRRFGTYQRSVK
jgi:ferredoxin